MKLDITKEWFETRAAAEGDNDPTTGRRKTMTINLTEDEIAELERLVNPNREAIREEAFEEAASLVEAQWNHCWPSDIAAAIRALATQAPAQNAPAPVTTGQGVETLEDLLDQYFDIGVREGREKRDHDDMVGSAQLTREKIRAAFNADRKYPAALATPTPKEESK